MSETNYYPKKMGDSEELEVNENGLKGFSMEEVEEHKVARGPDKSIWMVIHDKVFDVTKFLDEHPGGEEILIENAGLDATEAFEDVGHSTDAREMLREYLVGELIEEDRKGTTDSGPKSWATGTVQDDENSWTSWILPVMAALAASAFYR